MSSVQIHLALTHVPVILSIVGMIMLVIGLLSKKAGLATISYFILVIAGIAAIPVFLTGEGAEEAVEKLPGVSESLIEKHEDVAKMAMIAICIAGFLSLVTLLASKWKNLGSILRPLVAIVAIVAGGLLFQTAHLGGQIRHTEIRNGMALQNNEGKAGTEKPGGSSGQEKDDD